MTDLNPKRGQCFKQGSYVSVSRKTRSWSFCRANLVARTGLGVEETSTQMLNHLILINLRGDSERGGYRIDGQEVDFMRRKAGDLLFIPAGSHWHGWEEGAPTAAYLALSFEPAFFGLLCSDIPNSKVPSLSPDLCFRDAIISNAARGVGVEMAERSPFATMLLESYAATIAAQLIRRGEQRWSMRKGGLSPRLLRQVLEMIDENLSTELAVFQLAGEVGLSVSHFCRAFKESVGLSPYAFILQNRIEKAKYMLSQTSTPVTEIAFSCGFSSSSHLSNMFKRYVGTSPITYRQDWPGRLDG